MKKLLFLLLTVILFSCQIYTDTSNPALNLNGRWQLSDINGSYDHYKTGDVWEFDYNNLTLRNNNGLIIKEYYIGYVLYQNSPSDMFTLTDKKTNEYMGMWKFLQDGIGSAPATNLVITPSAFPNLLLIFERD